MPIYLRRFYLKKLIDTKKDENKAIENAQKHRNQSIAHPGISKQPSRFSK
jgi:hypothetical protein